MEAINSLYQTHEPYRVHVIPLWVINAFNAINKSGNLTRLFSKPEMKRLFDKRL